MRLSISIKLWLPAALLAAGLLLFLTPARVHADGGAPNLAYVSGTGDGVSVVDVMQQKVVRTIKVAGDPHEVTLSLDGRFLYVTQPAANRVVVIAAKTGDTFCTANVPGHPTLISMDPNSGILYAAGAGSASVTMLDPTNCQIKHTFQVGGPVYGLAVAAVGSAVSSTGGGGNQLWVAASDHLTIFDDATGHPLGQVAVPAGPRFLSIPPGTSVYVTTQQGQVIAVDLTSHAITPLIAGGVYGPMDFNEGTGEIYVPDQKNNRLEVLAPVNSGFKPPQEPAHEVNFSVKPLSVAITSDGQLAFVALDGGQVSMLDIPGHEKLITNIQVGGSPRFIITGLYPPSIGTTPAQASFLNVAVVVAGYAIVAVLIFVPLILFFRYSQKRNKKVLKKV